MDFKNALIGIVLLGTAFTVMFWQGKQYSDLPILENVPSAVVSEEKAGDTSKRSSGPSRDHNLAERNGEGLFERAQALPLHKTPKAQDREQITVLENDFIRVHFTNIGGAVRSVAFKHYPRSLDTQEPFLFNDYAENPALGLAFMQEGFGLQTYDPEYKIVNKTENSILFEAKTEQGISIYRGYKIWENGSDLPKDPYVILHETRFVNRSAENFNLKKLYINLGNYPPTRGDNFGEYLNAGYFDGKSDDFIKIGALGGSSGFLGFGKKDPVEFIEKRISPIVWGSVKNQFFASVLTPSEPADGLYITKALLPESARTALGVDSLESLQASLIVDLGQIASSEERLLDLEYYVGPKEFARLDALGAEQDRVMQFGFLGFISKLLLLLMTFLHKFLPNWGWTIVGLTVIIKLILWPLTTMQVRSSKRMAAIQAPLKALKEKYANSPQKLQMETMKLFKEHGVNPAAGCLPLFVQLPIFLGLYFMLRTASELRFAHFLWIPDLSVPDTVGFIAGFPINVLPLIMASTMFIQMHMVPTPTTDNLQRKIFQLMPFIFLIFCYNFPAGLVLYWTVQNLFTIIQQRIIHNAKDPMKEILAAKQAEAGKSKRKKSSKKAE